MEFTLAGIDDYRQKIDSGLFDYASGIEESSAAVLDRIAPCILQKLGFRVSLDDIRKRNPKTKFARNQSMKFLYKTNCFSLDDLSSFFHLSKSAVRNAINHKKLHKWDCPICAV